MIGRERGALMGAMVISIALIASACSSSDQDSIVIYSGRSEELVGPLIERFTEATGIKASVRYGDSAELAATILEEGENTPADVFFAQDPASLGVVAEAGLFGQLGESVMARSGSAFSDDQSRWVGVSGRARVVVYDTTKVSPSDLPESEDGFADPQWDGKIAIAPTNGSFLAFVAAKILLDGEEATSAWLQAIADNSAQTYPRNSVIVAAVDDGAVDIGLINHYYLFRRIDEVGDVAAANHHMTAATAGSLVMPAGVGLLRTSEAEASGAEFALYLLSDDAQRYFAEETFEYPLAHGIAAHPNLPPIGSLNPPDLDLSLLATVLDKATDLVAAAGLL